MQLEEITNRAQWDDWVAGHPFGHPLQLWGWGEVKRLNGWTPLRLAWVEDGQIKAAAQMLLWPIPRLGKMVAYVPRGPVIDPVDAAAHAFIDHLRQAAKGHRALYLKLEPAWREFAFGSRWEKTEDHVLLPETFTIDLSQSEDEMLEKMSRKHRQYIRKAEREGVKVVECRHQREHLGRFGRIYSQTAKRAGFSIHAKDYYDELSIQLGDSNHIYYAEIDGQPEAVLWVATAGTVAFELYGGVTEKGQDNKANYALKMQAIRDAKAAGLKLYDFNGRLNEGVSQFKEGFGPDETDWVGTYHAPIDKTAYAVWSKLFPILKPIGRKIIGGRK
ncbi:MAG TPA: peptidoglycan bridge formation glycyltransferase FemA/FemB family protein [Candidatus Saccharimonadales bacterium]|nr:peptidoglycan bridge formation glycyltransferase FemA/FemB family protein [Candidatus Saccharimonadales bacterium]